MKRPTSLYVPLLGRKTTIGLVVFTILFVGWNLDVLVGWWL